MSPSFQDGTRLERAERSVLTAAILATSGGFLDAFTYLGHGRVFANAMTGNVVLLAVAASTGHVSEALRHVPPILAFLLGVRRPRPIIYLGCAPACRIPRSLP